MHGVEPAGIRYVRPIRPLHFPASDPEWEMGEGKRHQLLCELLRQILAVAAGEGSSVGSDQFLYFDASNPQRKCAPDGFVKLGVPDELFDTWTTSVVESDSLISWARWTRRPKSARSPGLSFTSRSSP